MIMIEFASMAQVNLIRDLCNQLGYVADDYLVSTLTKEKANEIISEMLKEV